METSSHPARYVTLRDYLRVLRRFRIAIVLIAAAGAAAGYFTAKRQTPVYQATSVVAFQDPLQDLSYVGFSSNTVDQPGELASEEQETIARPQVLAQVQRLIRTSRPVSSLQGAVSGQVTTAGLLDVVATTSTPQFAAQLANGVASVLVSQSNTQTQTQFAGVAQDLQREITSLSNHPRSAAAAANELPVYEDELARLQTVSRLAKSANIDQVAQPPSAPTSPKPFRSAVIGLLIGLLLAIVIAFFRDSMDRRLRTPHDIESSFRLPVIGHVRKQMMGQIAHTANGGGDHALDLEAFRILRRNLEFLSSDGSIRTVLVTSALPEEGKTTVAGSLAFAMASAGHRTLLVDCDLRRPALASRLEAEPRPGISDFLDGKATPDQILRQVQFHDPPSANGTSANGATAGASHDLVFIPAGSPTSRAAELLGSSRFEQFLDQVKEVYDMVVIDSSPLLPVADTLEMLPHVDGVIVCVRERQTTRDQAVAAKTALARFPERPTGVVITGVDPRRDDNQVYSYTYTHAYS